MTLRVIGQSYHFQASQLNEAGEVVSPRFPGSIPVEQLETLISGRWLPLPEAMQQGPVVVSKSRRSFYVPREKKPVADEEGTL